MVFLCLVATVVSVGSSIMEKETGLAVMEYAEVGSTSNNYASSRFAAS